MGLAGAAKDLHQGLADNVIIHKPARHRQASPEADGDSLLKHCNATVTRMVQKVWSCNTVYVLIFLQYPKLLKDT